MKNYFTSFNLRNRNISLFLLFFLLISSFSLYAKSNAGNVENFADGIPSGWQVVDANKDGKTFSGNHENALNGSKNFAGGDLIDDYLISPLCSIDEKHKKVTFSHSSKGSYDYYELKVYVVEELPKDMTFSDKDKVLALYFEGEAWGEASFDLSKWVGKNVHIVFYGYNRWGASVNSVCGITDVKGLQTVSTEQNNIAVEFPHFPAVEEGKTAEGALTIRQKGATEAQITAIKLTAPFALKSAVSFPFTLSLGEEKTFSVICPEKKEGVTKGTIEVWVNGKLYDENKSEIISETLSSLILNEDFETEYFPPLGWEMVGKEFTNWQRTTTSDGPYHGKTGVYHSSLKESGTDYLILPRIKASKHDTLLFYAKNTSKKGTLDIMYSNDKKEWKLLKNIPLTTSYARQKVELPSDININYLAFSAKRSVYIDSVAGVHLFVPATLESPKILSPKNMASDIAKFKRAVLSWEPLYYAEGYKLTVGTPDAPKSILDNEDIGNVCRYELNGLKYNKKYIWKIKAYRRTKESDNAVFNTFITAKDPTISNFPYKMGFEDNESDADWAHHGWYRAGKPVNSGKYAACTMNSDKGWSTLTMPPLLLPEQQQISFYFVHDILTSSSKDASIGRSADKKEKSVSANSRISTFIFEASTDWGNSWNHLDSVSTAAFSDKYERARYNLSDFSKKPLLLRWRYQSGGNLRAPEWGIDDIVVGDRPTAPKVHTSERTWNIDLAKINQSVASPDTFFIKNTGAGSLTVRAVEVSAADFSIIGDISKLILKEEETHKLAFSYKPSKAGKRHETIHIYFNEIEVPVIFSVKAKVRDVASFFDDFESYPAFSMQYAPWISWDRDNHPTWGFDNMSFPMEKQPLGFFVMNVDKTTPPLKAKENHPLSGKQCLAVVPTYPAEDGTKTSNDDWIIYPYSLFGKNAELVLNAKSVEARYLESFEVLISTEGNGAVKDFKKIAGPISVPARWAEFTFDLSSYAGKHALIAIRCVSKQKMMMYLDDIALYDISSVNHAPKIAEIPSSKEAVVNKEFSLPITFSDAENDRLTVEKEGAKWLSLKKISNTSYLLQGLPGSDDIKAHRVTLRATDGYNTVFWHFSVTVKKDDTAIESVENEAIRIYPNPVRKELHINTGKAIKKVVIFNVQGMEVFAMDVQEEKSSPLSIDLHFLPQGVYVLQLTDTDNVVRSSRVVKR